MLITAFLCLTLPSRRLSQGRKALKLSCNEPGVLCSSAASSVLLAWAAHEVLCSSWKAQRAGKGFLGRRLIGEEAYF